MSVRIRRAVAAFATVVLLVASAVPAAAYSTEEHANTPVVFDAVIVRPLGFSTFVFGSALFVAAVPLVLVTRPQDMGKPFEALVAKPARFVWGDPLGGH